MLTDTSADGGSRTRALVGKCYCGAVAYRVEDAFVYASNCHCSNCRRTTGAAFKPFAGIEREKLELIEGTDSLLVVGDDELNDTHCAACGSLLYSVVRDGAWVHVALGSLVDAPTMRPTKHIFVGSKAPWFEITDDLPRFEEHATTGAMAVNIINAENPDGRIDAGHALESAETAMFVYDLAPGEGSSPYHYEYTEEWLLVVEGTVVVRRPDGEEKLERGDLIRFPAGPTGAHKVMNRSDAPARTLVFSSARLPAVSVYPDSDKIGVWPGNDADDLIFTRESAVPWSHGEDDWDKAV